MKICEVVPSLELQYGGPTRSVYGLSRALANAGHDVRLFATDPRKSETRDEAGLKITILRRDWPQRVCPSAALRDALRANDAEVFHHHALWLRTVHYTHHAARGRGVFVLSPRGMLSTWAWRHHGARKQFARVLVHPGALTGVDGWHATSAAEETEIRARGFGQPVCVAPNGVDEPDEAALRLARAHWHEACPDAAQRPVALFYSRFHRKKRVLELVDLWRREGPRDWLLLLVGIPEDYTLAELARHAGESSGADRIAIFSGLDRPPPYAVASLLLLPSHNENFGLVVAEALAHGVPALVTDTTPWTGLDRERCGWCVPWPAFGEALGTATAESASELRDRGLRGRAWVLREFSWDNSARRLAEFYRTLRR